MAQISSAGFFGGEIDCRIDDLASLHPAYERPADPEDVQTAGAREAAELSAAVGSLLSALGRPVTPAGRRAARGHDRAHTDWGRKR
jgi:hypothetical protein